MCLPRRLTWLQAGGTTTTCSYFLETKAAADRPKAQPKAHLYLLRIWEKLGGRSSLTAWQQRSDIGCQASRITCAAPAEHLTPATGARLQCPRVQDNCTTAYYNAQLLQSAQDTRTAVERSPASAPLSRPHLPAHRHLLSLPLSTHKPIVVDLPAGLRPASA